MINAAAASLASRLESRLNDTLRRLTRHVYYAFVPDPTVKNSAVTSEYLVDLWRDAPWFVALGHTLLNVVVLVLPVFRGKRPALIYQLSAKERDEVITNWLASPFYLLRVIAYGVRGNAFVAVFRDPLVRSALVPEPLYSAPSPKATSAPQKRSAEPLPKSVDYLVIGSGAGGATVGMRLAEAGKEVAVLEEGGWFETKDYSEDLYSSVKNLFRDYGTQLARGRSVFPVLQGSCVGGSTVINGAISHRLPAAIYEEWARDRGIEKNIPFSELENHAAQIEAELGIMPNIQSLLPKLPVSVALRRLGWNYDPMSRNAPGCQGSGRCLQGCPSAGKLSMELSFIPRLLNAGGKVYARQQVQRIYFEGKTASGVEVRDARGQTCKVEVRKAIVLAAGAIHSPLLLRRSGIGNKHIGRHFLCHLGVGAVGEMPSPVRDIEGPPQGIEVTQFSEESIKLATQLLPPELILARSPVVGQELLTMLRRGRYMSSWTASIRSNSEGDVANALFGKANIRFTPTETDMQKIRFAVRQLGELFFELGALRVFPGIYGAPPQIVNRRNLYQLLEAPLDPRSYNLGVGHIFGTCRLGSDASKSAIGTDFQPHGYGRLFVADASLFPTSTGVNPQLAIMSLASAVAERVLHE